MRPALLTAISMALLSATAALGCGKSARQKDCALVLPAVRDVSERLHGVLGAATPDPAAMEAKAQSVEAAGRDLAALSISDEGVQRYVARYQETLTKGAKLTRDLGAVTPTDVPGVTGATLQAQGAAFVVDEARLVAELGEYCH